MNVNPRTQEQQQQQQQQRRIWKCHFSRDPQWGWECYIWYLRPVYGLFGINRSLLTYGETISEVHNKVRQHVVNSVPQNTATTINIGLTDVRPNEEELAILARCCQSLAEQLKRICLYECTDNEAYQLLHYLRLASLKTKNLFIAVRRGYTLTTTIPLLRDVLHTGGGSNIEFVRFTSDDCRIIGHQIVAIKEVRFWHCSFPSLDDISTILGACFVSETILNFGFCVLRDKTIPHSNGTEFHRILCAFYQRERTTVSGGSLLNEAVRKFHAYVEPLRDTGFPSLLIPSCQHAVNGSSSRKLEEWVQVFSHSAVNDRVDLIFHLLSSDPRACVAASLRQNKQNASLTLQCWARCCNAAKKQIKTRQGEKSRALPASTGQERKRSRRPVESSRPDDFETKKSKSF